MKRSLLLLFIIALGTGASAQDWKQFSDTAIQFTASYPSSWTNKIKDGKRVFFTSPAESETDDFKENINISVTTNPSYGTSVKIRDLFPDVTNRIKGSVQEFKDEGLRFFTFNNQDAAEIKYSGYFDEAKSARVRIIQWFCFYKTRLYTVTFTAKAGNTRLDATALRIMNSIRFTP